MNRKWFKHILTEKDLDVLENILNDIPVNNVKAIKNLRCWGILDSDYQLYDRDWYDWKTSCLTEGGENRMFTSYRTHGCKPIQFFDGDYGAQIGHYFFSFERIEQLIDREILLPCGEGQWKFDDELVNSVYTRKLRDSDLDKVKQLVKENSFERPTPQDIVDGKFLEVRISKQRLWAIAPDDKCYYTWTVENGVLDEFLSDDRIETNNVSEGVYVFTVK